MRHWIMLSLTFVLTFALTMPASAEDKEALPLPDALVAAKTVYVANAGVPTKAIENTIKAITSLKRWGIATNAAEADITLTISAQPTTLVYNWALGTNMAIQLQFLAITDNAGTSLYGAVFSGFNPQKALTTLQKRLERIH
jgi:hypothetical protein